jgi:hypothetical protein
VLVTVDALRADAAARARRTRPHAPARRPRGTGAALPPGLCCDAAYELLAGLADDRDPRPRGDRPWARAFGAERDPRGAPAGGRLRHRGLVSRRRSSPSTATASRALASRHWDLNHASENWDDASTRVRSALQWARTLRRDQRAFAWVHLFEPHEPYVQHPEHPYGRGGEGALRRRVQRRRRRAGDADGGMVTARTWIITADHGEEFGEHGGSFHGTSLYDEQARVPLVIVADGVAPRVVSSPVSLVDVLPDGALRGRGDHAARGRGRRPGPPGRRRLAYGPGLRGDGQPADGGRRRRQAHRRHGRRHPRTLQPRP